VHAKPGGAPGLTLQLPSETHESGLPHSMAIDQGGARALTRAENEPNEAPA
jgi:hypothetical protein